MKKRYLKTITVNTKDPLPDNVVQIVEVERRYLLQIIDDAKIYKANLIVVVEE